MTTIIVPQTLEDEAEKWPSLGPQVCQFIEERLVFGPGDKRGERAVLTNEKRFFIYVLYQVYPKEHALYGRRRFRQAALSLPKGLAKTEFAAWIAACELHPEAPVRCDGFFKKDSRWIPVGRPVDDPMIFMVAYTEEQTEDLAYAALKAILEESDEARFFDIGLERIMRSRGKGKAVALSASPNSGDGRRTTFQHKDETHLWTPDRLKKAAQTMTLNLAKRLGADPWELETTTAFLPGEGSVAEETMEKARDILDGRITRESGFFFFHRQASESHDLSTDEGIRAAVEEATGQENLSWRNVPMICDMAHDPKIDRSFWMRMYLNLPNQDAAQAFDFGQWDTLQRDGVVIEKGETITLGFDGSRHVDSTAIVATHVRSGYQWLLGIWERPQNAVDWEVPRAEVDAIVEEAFATWKVWGFYCDPPQWDNDIDRWKGQFGDKKVEKKETYRVHFMGKALRAFRDAIQLGDLTHDGDATLGRHIANARRRATTFFEEDGQPIWMITKDRPDSPRKIDAAIAAVLSWQARNDAIAAGAANEQWHGIYVPA